MKQRHRRRSLTAKKKTKKSQKRVMALATQMKIRNMKLQRNRIGMRTQMMKMEVKKHILVILTRKILFKSWIWVTFKSLTLRTLCTKKSKKSKKLTSSKKIWRQLRPTTNLRTRRRRNQLFLNRNSLKSKRLLSCWSEPKTTNSINFAKLSNKMTFNVKEQGKSKKLESTISSTFRSMTRLWKNIGRFWVISTKNTNSCIKSPAVL